MAFEFGLVDHLVVLMMENRSFDHMLGSLDSPGEGWTVEGLTTGRRKGTVVSNLDLGGRPWGPGRLKAHAHPFHSDPPHERDAVKSQINGGRMDGFVSAFQEFQAFASTVAIVDLPHPEDVLGHYTRDDLPVLYFLADNGAVCDHWFCSVPASTFPNRLYSLCGGSDGVEKTSGFPKIDVNLCSIFDLLDDRDWAIYSAPLGGVASLAADLVGLFEGLEPPVPGCTPMFLRGWPQKRNVKAHWHDLDDLGAFASAALRGTLPRVTWIESRDADLQDADNEPNDDHPPTPIEAGQRLMAAVYQALISNRESWNRTVLVITYDEHGGFYDHVAPPPLGEALTPNDRALGFETFGPRVPAIVVSPLVERGTRKAVSTQCEHASVLRFICDWQGIDPARLSERVAKANSIAAALTRSSPDPAAFPAPPDAAGLPGSSVVGSGSPQYEAMRRALGTCYSNGARAGRLLRRR